MLLRAVWYVNDVQQDWHEKPRVKHCLWDPRVRPHPGCSAPFPQLLFINCFCPDSRKIFCSLSDDTSTLSHNLTWRNTSPILQTKRLSLSMGSGWDAPHQHSLIGEHLPVKNLPTIKTSCVFQGCMHGLQTQDRSWGLQDHKCQSKHGKGQRGISYQLCQRCSGAAGGVATSLTCPAPHTLSSHLLLPLHLLCRSFRGLPHAWETPPGPTT